MVLAKQLATLDIVSDGRLDVGVSLGWSQDEYEACGVPFKERGARLDEYLRCLQALWGPTIRWNSPAASTRFPVRCSSRNRASGPVRRSSSAGTPPRPSGGR